MTFLGMIFGQIGTAFAVRTQRESLWSVGVLSNRYLLLAIVGELAIAAACVYAPPLQTLLGTAPPPASDCCSYSHTRSSSGALTSYGATSVAGAHGPPLPAADSPQSADDAALSSCPCARLHFWGVRLY
jgi:Cation transporting ATPase, C-terminus